jgi:hypothetical protein
MAEEKARIDQEKLLFVNELRAPQWYEIKDRKKSD